MYKKYKIKRRNPYRKTRGINFFDSPFFMQRDYSPRVNKKSKVISNYDSNKYSDIDYGIKSDFWF